MTDPLGVPLRRRRGFIHALHACAAVFAVAVVAILLGGVSAATLATSAGLGLLFIVFPLAAAALLSRLQIHVSERGVVSTLGQRPGQTITWAEASAVHTRWEHGVGVMPRKPAVTVFAASDDTPPRQIHASERFFDLRPLLAQVAAQAARRPELITTDEDRQGLAEFSAAYGLG
jgi:hypothetical protein